MIASLPFWHGSASVIGIIWVGMGFIGLYLNRFNLNDTRKYREAVEKLNGNNLMGYKLMKVIAFGHYRNELFRLAFNTAVIFAGVFSVITAPAIPRGYHVPIFSPRTMVITASFFIMQLVGSILPSLLDKKQREEMGRMGDREQELEAQSREA